MTHSGGIVNKLESVAALAADETAEHVARFRAAMLAADESIAAIRALGVTVLVKMPFASHLPFSSSSLTLELRALVQKPSLSGAASETSDGH